MKTDITLATEVQWTSGVIAIKTVPGLHFTVNEKSQRRYTQQTTKKRSAKSSCHVLHKHFLGTNEVTGSLFNPFSNSGKLCSTSLILIFSDKSFCNC